MLPITNSRYEVYIAMKWGGGAILLAYPAHPVDLIEIAVTDSHTVFQILA